MTDHPAVVYHYNYCGKIDEENVANHGEEFRPTPSHDQLIPYLEQLDPSKEYTHYDLEDPANLHKSDEEEWIDVGLKVWFVKDSTYGICQMIATPKGEGLSISVDGCSGMGPATYFILPR